MNGTEHGPAAGEAGPGDMFATPIPERVALTIGALDRDFPGWDATPDSQARYLHTFLPASPAGTYDALEAEWYRQIAARGAR